MRTNNESLASEDVWPDGSPKRWPDGTSRSWNNAFTHTFDGRPIGYVVGSPIAPTPERRKRGPRSVMAFGTPEGTYQNPPPRVTVPPRQSGKLQKKAA